MNSFEEIQEQCIQNKEKVEKYSKIITVVLVIGIAILCYLFWDYELMKKCLYIIPSLFILIYFLYGNSDYRILSKFPAIITLVGITTLITFLSFKTEFFSEGFTPDCLINLFIYSFKIWFIIFSVNFLCVKLLDTTVFANPKMKYTAKIVGKKRLYITRYNYEYYALFYDYNCNLIMGEISKMAFDCWPIGCAIMTTLQQRVDGVAVKDVDLARNIEGPTDMEVFMNNQGRDVELFGESYANKLFARRKSKKISFKLPFVILYLILSFFFISIGQELCINLMNYTSIYASVAAVSLGITSIVSYFEYSRLKEKFSPEDIGLWTDLLIPRCSLYFLTSFFLITNILGLSNDLINRAERYDSMFYKETCTVKKSKSINYFDRSENYMLCERPDGSIFKVNIDRSDNPKVGNKVDIEFIKGYFGIDIQYKYHFEDRDKKLIN